MSFLPKKNPKVLPISLAAYTERIKVVEMTTVGVDWGVSAVGHHLWRVSLTVQGNGVEWVFISHLTVYKAAVGYNLPRTSGPPTDHDSDNVDWVSPGLWVY